MMLAMRRRVAVAVEPGSGCSQCAVLVVGGAVLLASGLVASIGHRLERAFEESRQIQTGAFRLRSASSTNI